MAYCASGQHLDGLLMVLLGPCFLQGGHPSPGHFACHVKGSLGLPLALHQQVAQLLLQLVTLHVLQDRCKQCGHSTLLVGGKSSMLPALYLGAQVSMRKSAQTGSGPDSVAFLLLLCTLDTGGCSKTRSTMSMTARCASGVHGVHRHTLVLSQHTRCRGICLLHSCGCAVCDGHLLCPVSITVMLILIAQRTQETRR